MAQDLAPRRTSAQKGLAEHFERDAVTFDVHLRGRDTSFGPRDLTVHAPEVVLRARRVRE